MSRGIERFTNQEGIVVQWPARRGDQIEVIAYLSTKFMFGKTYTEREVNDILKQWHTFSDWPLLRRELYDTGYLDRKIDGSAYWRFEPSPGEHS